MHEKEELFSWMTLLVFHLFGFMKQNMKELLERVRDRSGYCSYVNIIHLFLLFLMVFIFLFSCLCFVFRFLLFYALNL